MCCLDRVPVSITTSCLEMVLEGSEWCKRPVSRSIEMHFNRSSSKYLNNNNKAALVPQRPGPLPGGSSLQCRQSVKRIDRPAYAHSTPLLKRSRSREDVDGEETDQKQRKKRRLRHYPTSSWLSKPYATPATHVTSRKKLRPGVWTRQKVSGQYLLRKAAILNSFSKKRRKALRAEASQERPSLVAVNAEYGQRTK